MTGNVVHVWGPGEGRLNRQFVCVIVEVEVHGDLFYVPIGSPGLKVVCLLIFWKREEMRGKLGLEKKLRQQMDLNFLKNR